MAAAEATRYFPFLDPVEERAILAAAPLKTFARNDVVVDQNVRMQAIFFIEEGSVRVERLDRGQTALLAVLEPGEFFGEMSYVDGAPTSARVIADSHTRLRVLDEAAIHKLTQADPSFAGRLYRSIAAILAERLRMTSMHMDTLIEGIDFYSRIRGEIEAAASQLPETNWRSGLVAAVMAREEKKG
jgi:extracellular factor (EF) 3-hydroxypalmitic acid methyl ester biosynthesis protein